MIRLPGLIDPHVHLRTPGQEYKEDFYTGTAASLAGGFTTILDMPNNTIPITTREKLEEKKAIAQNEVVCDIGFHFGTLGNNFTEFLKIQEDVFGLKVYLNQTTGNFIVDEKVFARICEAWPKDKPILVHAEENIIQDILAIGHAAQQKIHVCHVSSAKELQTIISAKEKGSAVTCGVTPHHLFLSSADEPALGPFGKMKPTLKSKADVAFLWNHLSDIDIIESDHAPHTKEEKESTPTPFGVPGLETTLPLLLTAVHNNRLTLEEIKRMCYEGPKQIFFSHHPELVSDSSIQIDENEEWTITNDALKTKCGWSPFHGWKVKGKVKKTIIRGITAFENGNIKVEPGFGKIF